MPVPVGVGAPLVRDVKYQAMLRNLLVQRFKMATHYEDRVVDVFTLVAVKPMLKKPIPPAGRVADRPALPSGLRLS